MSCKECTRIFHNSVRARVVRWDGGGKFLVIPLPDGVKEWKADGVVSHMHLAMVKLLREVQRAFEELGAEAVTARDKRGHQVFLIVATWLSGVLEYDPEAELPEVPRLIDRARSK